jgi:DNA protecting protein DprA
MKQETLFDLTEDAPNPPPPDSGIPFAHALASLSTLRGAGSKTLKRLTAACGGDLGRLLTLTATEILEVGKDCRVANLKALAEVIESQRRELLDAGREQLESWKEAGVSVIGPAELPERLRCANPEPPQWLFLRGNAELLTRRPAIAVVGTREPSDSGLMATQVLIRYLAPYPVTIVSGLAEGIDHQAHETALDLRLPNVAFLGHGINVVFPLETAETRERILAEGGLLASEYLPHEHYQKAYFVERNRLQAALADLVIPVEAKVSGGTAHTFRYARQYGRLVMGVRFTGANGLLDTITEAGGLIYDMGSAGGERLVDRTVRRLVADAGQDTYPFRLLETSLVQTVKDKEPDPEHVARLLDRLRKRLLNE